MAQRRHHYELAFERFLRHRGLPYIAVDEARRAVLPHDATLSCEIYNKATERRSQVRLKSFDFIIYGQDRHLLIEIKGRKISRRGPRRPDAPTPRSRLESWVTLDDVESLGLWQTLFGHGYTGAFIFLYWCDEQPPAELFQEVFEHQNRWYALRAVSLDDYTRHMTTRSPRWRTVHIPTARFEAVSHPFAPATPAGLAQSRTIDLDPARLANVPALC